MNKEKNPRLAQVARVPDEKHNHNDGQKFVPRVVTVAFEHPDHGPTVWSAEDNWGNLSVMTWSTVCDAMFVSTAKRAKGTGKAMCATYKAAVVKTNYKPWEKPCL